MEGRSRRRVINGIVLACALAVVAASAQALRAAPATSQANAQIGTYALLDGTQEAIAKGWAAHPNNGSATIKVRFFERDGTTPIERFNINGTHTIRMSVIEDDFSSFTALEPYSNLETGTFSGSFTAQPNHSYYLYADVLPVGMHRQVFRFKSVAAGTQASPGISSTPTTVQAAGPYTVTLERATFPANSPEVLYLQVSRNGKPAEDLWPYNGASAQAIMVNTGTLAYVHVHPMLRGSKVNKTPTYTIEQEIDRLQSDSHVGANMQIVLPPLPAGVYKMWFEFKAGVSMDTFHTPAFTIAVH